MENIDEFDIGIMNCLQENVRLTSEVIAERVGLSPTACQRRIKKLRSSGAIAQEIAVISPDVVGGRMILLVQVTLNRAGPQIIDEFKREILKIPEVQQCYYVTGDYDFALIISVKDMAAYEKLTRNAFFGNLKIQQFHTTVVMDAVKVGLHIPL